MILELDIGNSRLKWRLVRKDGTRVAGGVVPHLPEPGEDYPWRGVLGRAPERVRIGSVAGADFDAALARELAIEGTQRVEFASSGARCGRLTAGYLEPAQMGVDRWLALAAAAVRTDGAFAVVDAGSAITLDLVEGDGRHLGGWILPGLRMMRSALLSGTAGIRLPRTDPDSGAVPGRSTAQAVAYGTVLMAQDFVVRRFEAFREAWPDARLFVTGGDGERVAAAVTGGVEVAPELVLDGLVQVVG